MNRDYSEYGKPKSLVIQLWQTDFDDVDRAATPFVLALTARAMDMNVAIHALGACVELFLANDERRHLPVSPLNRPLSQYIQEAVDAGVIIQLCSSALRDRNLSPLDFVDGCNQVIGMVSMIEAATASNTTLLTY